MQCQNCTQNITVRAVQVSVQDVFRWHQAMKWQHKSNIPPHKCATKPVNKFSPMRLWKIWNKIDLFGFTFWKTCCVTVCCMTILEMFCSNMFEPKTVRTNCWIRIMWSAKLNFERKNKGSPPWGGPQFSTIVYFGIEWKIFILPGNLQCFLLLELEFSLFAPRCQNAKKNFCNWQHLLELHGIFFLTVRSVSILRFEELA